LQNDFERTARLARFDHIDIESVERLGAFGHAFGERVARLDCFASIFERVFESPRFGLLAEDAQASKNGEAGVLENGKLAGEGGEVF